MPLKGISAVTTLLDFIYIAQYSTHDSITLGYMQDALDQFHKSCDYFIATLVQEDFNIPKFILSSTILNLLKTLGQLTNTIQRCLNVSILTMPNMDGGPQITMMNFPR